jgi:hypothetical protein
MVSDITLAVGDVIRRMTYAELTDTRRDPAIRALEHAAEGLCEQLENANERADRAEQRADLLQVKFSRAGRARRGGRVRRRAESAGPGACAAGCAGR